MADGSLGEVRAMLQTGQAAALSRAGLQACLQALHAIGEAATDPAGFARRGLESVGPLVPADLTTFSICDLGCGQRRVTSDVPGAIAACQLEAFDRHFHAHPLVREHARNPAAATRRISDLVPPAQFRRSALFDEYYRPMGIDHAMAVPIHVDRKTLVGFVFNRRGRDFDERDRACMEAIRPHLGDLFRLSLAMERARATQWAPSASPACGLALTPREREVLGWLAGGKTDRDIGEILGISPRTVHKHLQRLYDKLGVETRTAAVVRALGLKAQAPSDPQRIAA